MRWPSGGLTLKTPRWSSRARILRSRTFARSLANGASSARERLVVIGYTPRGADRHVFSMREANDREQVRIAPLLGL